MLQEFILSSDLVALVGSHKIDLSALASILRALYKQRGNMRPAFYMSLFDNSVSCYFMFHLREFPSHISSVFDLDKLLYSVAGFFEASDPRDVVYSLLGLVTLMGLQTFQLIPNYKKAPWEVFADAIKAFARGRGRLDHWQRALRTDPAANGRISSKILDLPSWTPDWSCYYRVGELISRHRQDDFVASRSRKYRESSKKQDIDEISIEGRIIGSLVGKGIHTARLVLPRFPYKLPQRVLMGLPIEECIDALDSLDLLQSCPRDLLRERLLRVFLANSSHKCGLSIAEVRSCLDTYYHIHDPQNNSMLDKSNDELSHSEPELFNRLLELEKLTVWAVNMYLLVTAEGKLGVGYGGTKSLDTIVIAHGCRTPIIVRKRDDSRYTFLGACYLEDAMFGEACTWAEENADEFILV